MARSFAEIAFTDSVKAQQEKYGSRKSYARMEAQERGTEIGEAEAEFIGERDGFYLATVGESGYPYVQFRGGPKGFLKVLDPKTLAYADFRGNMQYVSVGNLTRNDKAALILMDYANRRRGVPWRWLECYRSSSGSRRKGSSPDAVQGRAAGWRSSEFPQARSSTESAARCRRAHCYRKT